jgi:hypothetical protein
MNEEYNVGYKVWVRIIEQETVYYEGPCVVIETYGDNKCNYWCSSL